MATTTIGCHGHDRLQAPTGSVSERGTLLVEVSLQEGSLQEATLQEATLQEATFQEGTLQEGVPSKYFS